MTKGEQQMLWNIVDRQGLKVKLPTAKRFKRWVTSEVLPAIRRHGLYAVDDMLNKSSSLWKANMRG